MKLADISFVFNYNKTLNKKGEGAIHIRIYLKRRKLIPTGIHIKPEHWDSDKEKIKGRSDNDLLNIQLLKKKRAYEDRQEYLFKKSLPITLESITNTKNPDMFGNMSFTEFCEKEIELRADISESTKVNHRTYLTRLKEFQERIYFSDIDFELLKSYENFLLSYEFEKNKKKFKIGKTRVYNYLKFFRTYLKLAIKNDLFDETSSPFKKWNIAPYTNAERQAAKNKTYLEYDEIKRIEALSFKGESAHLNGIKEFFLFQCYTGLAYNDMMRLKNEHVNHEVSLQGKGHIITLKRGKTDEPFYLPIYLLGDEAEHILTKRLKRTGKYLFADYTVQHLDRELKRIATAARIEKKITSHVGRHSCAMLLRRKNIPIDVIQKILAHASLKSTQIYANIDKDIIRSALKNQISINS